ncbi:endonuclease-reverse transcriptase [Plakobranchus ocellatus]|uniref:Endonuclease-reverse transcriptase n=1 Tax=Plakobranchus ocellatus TaxID=259542 RepID=A0AAV4AKM7_9GAST|nr:endonuclease-reverse transcriptase [Plakobranchus ocellatus]
MSWCIVFILDKLVQNVGAGSSCAQCCSRMSLRTLLMSMSLRSVYWTLPSTVPHSFKVNDYFHFGRIKPSSYHRAKRRAVDIILSRGNTVSVNGQVAQVAAQLEELKDKSKKGKEIGNINSQRASHGDFPQVQINTRQQIPTKDKISSTAKVPKFSGPLKYQTKDDSFEPTITYVPVKSENDMDYGHEDLASVARRTIKATVRDVRKTKQFYILYLEDKVAPPNLYDEASLFLDSLNRKLYVTFDHEEVANRACMMRHDANSNIEKLERATVADFDTFTDRVSMHGFCIKNTPERQKFFDFVINKTQMRIKGFVTQDEPRSVIIIFEEEDCYDITEICWQLMTDFEGTKIMAAPVYKTKSVRVSNLPANMDKELLRRYMTNSRSGGGDIESLEIRGGQAKVTFKSEEPNSNDEDLDKFYNELDTAKRVISGTEKVDDIVGKHGLGIRNELGEKLIEWCQTNNIIVGNTWFQQPPRRKWTWKSPGDETRNQIDYMMISKRYRNALLLAKTYPSADCYSDHVPVVGKFKLKLKKNSKPFTNIKFDLAILKTNQTIREKYQISVQNKFEALGDAEEVEQQWENFKSAIMEAATDVIPKVKRKAKQKWMTEEILNLMEERRCAKGNKEKYEQIHKKVQEKCNMSKENWINEKCKEIEQQRKHVPQTMYRNIEELTGKRTFLSTGCIKTMNGDIIIDKEKILERWAEYIRELFKDDRKDHNIMKNNFAGPPIVRTNVVMFLFWLSRVECLVCVCVS